MNTILDEMSRQSVGVKPENFLCSSCMNYQGSLVCTKGIFIAFEGANMLICRFHKPGRPCPHCGRMI